MALPMSMTVKDEPRLLQIMPRLHAASLTSDKNSTQLQLKKHLHLLRRRPPEPCCHRTQLLFDISDIGGLANMIDQSNQAQVLLA